MPVEQTGRQFEFEFGEKFGAHFEAFDPTFARVLMRHNPDGEAPLNSRQEARLAQLTSTVIGDLLFANVLSR